MKKTVLKKYAKLIVERGVNVREGLLKFLLALKTNFQAKGICHVITRLP